MKTVASKPGRDRASDAARSQPPRKEGLGTFALKLDAAFREIVAGHITVREVEIAPPRDYDGRAVRATRARLGVSVAVFAQLVGVSPAQVEHWEQGRRMPAPLARRLLDRISADPERFLADLITRKAVGY